MKPHWHPPPPGSTRHSFPTGPSGTRNCGSPSWALAEPRNPTHRSPAWEGSFPLKYPPAKRAPALTGKAPAAAQELTPQMVPQGITHPPAGAPIPAGSSCLYCWQPFIRTGLFWTTWHLITYRWLGRAWLPLQPVVVGRQNPIFPVQGPLIPGQSPAEKAKRKPAVLPRCVGGWREHAK